jgi:hypothetical protein
MADSKTFRDLALAFADVTEAPHFNKAAFKVNKKIFATLQEEANIGMVQLTPAEQSLYCKVDPAIYPVPGGWGLKGSTYINLKKIKKTLLKEMLLIAYTDKLKK